MFEVGKYYDLKFGTAENWESSRVKVLAWEPPLLQHRADDTRRPTITNTSNPSFFEAEMTYSPEEVAEAERRFMQSTKS